MPGKALNNSEVLYAIDDGNTRVFFSKRGVSILMTDANKRKKNKHIWEFLNNHCVQRRPLSKGLSIDAWVNYGAK